MTPARLTLLAILAAILLASCSKHVPFVEHEYPADYANGPFREAVWQGAVNAGAHVRYHEKLATHYDRIDYWVRWTGVLLGVFALAWPLMFSTITKRAKAIWTAVGVAALVASLTPIISDYGEFASRHTVLQKRWNDVKGDWDSLLRVRDELPIDELQSSVEKLSARSRAIEEAEPPDDGDWRFNEAWNEEYAARHRKMKVAPTKTDVSKQAAL